MGSPAFPVLASPMRLHTPLNARITTARRSAHRSRLRAPMLAAVLLLAIGLGACGGDGGLVRQDYNAVIAPERCGGVSSVSCAGYQFTPTAAVAP